MIAEPIISLFLNMTDFEVFEPTSTPPYIPWACCDDGMMFSGSLLKMKKRCADLRPSKR
jgi:hypothetical protein